MKCAAVVLGLGSAFLLALAPHRSIAGETSATTVGYWHCQNVPILEVAYFSAIFEASASNIDVNREFAQMLAAKYGYKGQTNCGVANKGPTILAKLKEDQARFVKQLQQSQIKVFETGWVPASVSTPAP